MHKVWNRIGKSDGCWLWFGTRNAQGYGLFNYADETGKKRCMGAHRAAYMSHHNLTSLPPETPLVLHKCDNPMCCNPDHLFLGTHKINTDDKVAKGRCAKKLAFAPRQGILTDPEIRRMRRMMEEGYTRSQIAYWFDVSESTAYDVATRRRKAHVGDDGPMVPIPEYPHRRRKPTISRP
jgi:hypothetical protein